MMLRSSLRRFWWSWGMSNLPTRPDDWRSVELSDCVDILDHLRVPVNEEQRNLFQGDTPYYGANGQQGTIKGWLFDEPLILMAEDGGYFDDYENRPVAYKISGRAWVNNHAHVLRPKDGYDFNYIFYALEHKNVLPFIKGGTRAKLNQKELREVVIYVPQHKNVQEKISQILLSVDDSLKATQKLIHKYQQIKYSLMHDLFTRGVTGDGKLRPPREQAPELYKETPIGWIPKEWDVRSLAQLSDITSGVTLSSKVTSGQDIAIPYLRVANVQDGYLDLADVKKIKVNRITFEKLKLKQGDVLMNEGGDFDKLGRGTVWQGEIANCIHQNHVFRVRVNSSQLEPFYLAYWSQSEFGKKYFVLSSKQSTNLASINSTQLKAFPIGLPGFDEQKRIVVRINAINEKIKMLSDEGKKLTSRKFGLMQDLLTGKVQVKVDQQETEHV
ncbi:MAG: restriction endonuclease subunit S [Candidatus Electrothrix sp. ATG2]|nr:restriction endonuclease subunit S [Candidatus Electrothrix sp. ATG2]